MNASLFIQIKQFQHEGEKKKKAQPCNEQTKDLNLSLLHWDEYLDVYFLNWKECFDSDD